MKHQIIQNKMEQVKHDAIIVLDFGSQYNQLIVRRIRDLNVYSELCSYDIKAQDILKKGNIKGIIFSGGPNSVIGSSALRCDPEIYKLGLPILGICYGMQLMSFDLKGTIQSANNKEYGGQEVSLDTSSPLFSGLNKSEMVWMSHSDSVKELPLGFKNIAKSKTCKNAAITNDHFYGLQFHPEVRNTTHGIKILENFIFKICQAKPTWKIEDLVQVKIQEIKDKVKNEKVLLAISGGVDSTVAAVLINRAIGDQLTCMFIDHGLLRKNEKEEVLARFAKFGIKVRCYDESKRFLTDLKGVSDPEKKRHIIGKDFIDSFAQDSKELGTFKFLAQGTLYTDVIESGTKTAETIKSHHNVGGLPSELPFTLLEPLNQFYKDEVRRLGKSLGIPNELVERQPFPGPGLAIRIIGDITEEKLEVVRESDAILREEIAKHGLNTSIWQYFTLLPGVRSVGVMGDQRTYSYVVAIRAVTSIDGMSADWAKIPYDVLDIISRRIVNEVKLCNRVVYDITSKPPATIEWE